MNRGERKIAKLRSAPWKGQDAGVRKLQGDHFRSNRKANTLTKS